MEEVLENRLGAWADFRRSLIDVETPLQSIAEYWSETKLIPFNHAVDPYNQHSWPTPWDIIAENKYDELTLAIMIGYTIKLTEAYKDSQITVRTMVDSTRTRLYTLVYVDDEYVLNYNRDRVVKALDIPESFLLENIVELARPR